MNATKIQKASQTPALENVTNDAARVISDAMLGIGDTYPQGDIYFVRIAAMPRGAKPRHNRQLADGNTQGSRHVCEVGRVFDVDAKQVIASIKAANHVAIDARYIGPVIETDEGRALVTHPEHGDHDYQGDLVLACVFQRALDAEEREARVRD